jgi:hypothetical protein
MRANEDLDDRPMQVALLVELAAARALDGLP